MSDIKKYIRDLKIVKNNLIKFYYNSSSEWLKNDILSCINAVNEELASYQALLRKYVEKNNATQTTIFTFSEEEGLGCQIIKL